MKNFTFSLLLLALVSCTSMQKPVVEHIKLTPEQIQKNITDAAALKPEHAVLNRFVGNWRTETKLWMDAAKSPEVSKGYATASLIYGGRYLQYSYKGKFMGQPFYGQGNMGYDNVAAQYFSTWIDSMSTMMMRSNGSMLNANTMVLTSAMVCPMSRQRVDSEEIYTFFDKNSYKLEVYQNQNDRKVKVMEIDYKRVAK